MQNCDFDIEFLTLVKSKLWKTFIKTKGEITAAIKMTQLCHRKILMKLI